MSSKSSVDVWLEKTGQSAPKPDNEKMMWGRMLEDVIAHEYTRRTGNKTRRVNDMIRHPDHEFITGNIDRKITGQNRLLEIKTAGKFWKPDEWGEPGTDIVPPYYLLQVQQYLEITRYDAADLAALLAGNEYRQYEIRRDAEIGKMIVAAAVEFWLQVKEMRHPIARQYSDSGKLYRRDNGKSVIATAEISALVADLKSANAALKELETAIDEKKAAICNFMADAAFLSDQTGGTVATWKNQDTTRIDTTAIETDLPDVAEKYSKTTQSRVFRLK